MTKSTRLAIVQSSVAPGPEDAERLQAALRSGDRVATEAVLLELLPRVRGWLQRLLAPGPDLDDAVQDALAEIALALPRFEGRARLTTFAHRITVRIAYRYFGRHKRADASLELVAPPVSTLDPESHAMEREALRCLYRCLDRLPNKRRVAFVLCAIEGLSPAEASEVAGTSAVAMRSRLMRARAEVARMLRHDPYVVTLLQRGMP